MYMYFWNVIVLISYNVYSFRISDSMLIFLDIESKYERTELLQTCFLLFLFLTFISDIMFVYYCEIEDCKSNYVLCLLFHLLWISGQESTLPAGTHNFNFSYVLPQNIPSSFESKIGQVRHVCKAKINVPWGFDKTCSQPYSVNSLYDLNTDPAAQASIMYFKWSIISAICLYIWQIVLPERSGNKRISGLYRDINSFWHPCEYTNLTLVLLMNYIPHMSYRAL